MTYGHLNTHFTLLEEVLSHTVAHSVEVDSRPAKHHMPGPSHAALSRHSSGAPYNLNHHLSCHLTNSIHAHAVQLRLGPGLQRSSHSQS
jgi:hypothetical protein